MGPVIIDDHVDRHVSRNLVLGASRTQLPQEPLRPVVRGPFFESVEKAVRKEIPHTTNDGLTMPLLRDHQKNLLFGFHPSFFHPAPNVDCTLIHIAQQRLFAHETQQLDAELLPQLKLVLFALYPLLVDVIPVSWLNVVLLVKLGKAV